MSANREEDESSVYGFTFNRKKVKYAVLNELFEERILDTSVTLFLDMKYILDIMRIKYYAEMVEKELVRDSNRVIGEILNYIVHYKRYFVDKRGCTLDVVLMFDDGGTPDKFKSQVVPEYDSTRIAKTIKPKFLGFLAEKMQRFSHCIPDLYVINSRDVQLTVIPQVIKSKISESKYNVFISNDPLIQQYSQIYKGFFHLQPAGDNSRVVTTNGYFAHVYEKSKYAVKNPDETKTHDSFVQLFMNLTGDDDVPLIENYKSKKAIDLVNKVKKTHTLFNDYAVLSEFGLSEESISTMTGRHMLVSVVAHANSLGDDDVLSIHRQVAAANKVSRPDFDHYNFEAFDNRVDAVTLFI
jgi:hypothetical protein